MVREQLVTIDAASYLVARGRDAIIKAMQRDRIKNEHTLRIGETSKVTLLPLFEVLNYWAEKGVHSWFKRRLEDIKSTSFVVTTEEGEWEIFPGQIDIYSADILRERLEKMREADSESK